MDYISLQNIASLMFADNLLLQQLLDLLLKSSVIIIVTLLIIHSLKRKLSHNAKHLVWLNSLLCVVLLPLVGNLSGILPTALFDSGTYTIISIKAGSAGVARSTEINFGWLLISGYYLVSAALLIRFLFAALSLRRLGLAAKEVYQGPMVEQLQDLSKRIGVSPAVNRTVNRFMNRKVSLKLSREVNSPISFGLFNPVIVIPESARQWSASALEDVFLHELSHIRRLDWPVMLFCHLLCSLFWINPLLWLAKARINDEAEHCCDAAVVIHGKDGVAYAEDLLSLAKISGGEMRAPVLAQLMFEKRGLTMRIKNILEGNSEKSISKMFVSTVMGFVVLSVTAFSNVEVFGASDEEYLPITAIAPQYPTRAAQSGTEGWVLVSFTVKADGSVDSNSLETVDSEPEDVFDRNSYRAAAKFVFSPRVVNGQAVDVEGVQYLFRYSLENDNVMEGVRQPPRARDQQ